MDGGLYDLYEKDFYAWTQRQAALLRAGNLSEADIAHIAEEIESMGRSEKRELISRLTILLLHLLKWQYQPERRGTSWEATILVQRDDLEDHLADNPSLRAGLDAALVDAYRKAALLAVAETGLARGRFPEACPWSVGEVLGMGFWPG
ncbi:DUF29 domain-containing protein [Niveispirillum sp. KHB5.9]|uniref:DUF29 domain-containing protein n=1 Tax=Niveispirillum sp. KHB5.9 TaxID=3400269 RepID=UPI003A86040E